MILLSPHCRFGLNGKNTNDRNCRPKKQAQPAIQINTSVAGPEWVGCTRSAKKAKERDRGTKDQRIIGL
jgi:hypothetical protein